MFVFFLISATGWMAVFLAGITIALPYMLRSAPQKNEDANGVRARFASLRTRMWPHYWIGYALVALASLHTSFVTGPIMGRTDAIGIWAATLALGALFLQAGLGLTLKGGQGNPGPIRRWHFWSMIGFVALLLIHLGRNT